MGNRGTTRSWDEEEIEKWGLFDHLANVRRGLDMRLGISKRQRESELMKLLTLLRNLLKAKEEAEPLAGVEMDNSWNGYVDSVHSAIKELDHKQAESMTKAPFIVVTNPTK